MTYSPKYSTFKFESYTFDDSIGTAIFEYSFDNDLHFKESIRYTAADSYNADALDRALFMAFIIAGVSYYKVNPTKQFDLNGHLLTAEQAEFFSNVYRNGLSQFVFENRLSPADIAEFEANSIEIIQPVSIESGGISVLQSGGKDSLLLAELLLGGSSDFSAVYMQQGSSYPSVIYSIGVPLRRYHRTIDIANIQLANGLNGHVPVTYITLAYALIEAILNNASTVLAAIGREGEEPHAYIGDYAVTHQWSKTWAAEQLLAAYVHDYISADLNVGSPLRAYSELKIAELFVHHCWKKYSRSFSSCNVANYQQGHDNSELSWCGECPKCANSFLLFAAFVKPEELVAVFKKDLFGDPQLVETFKGLLGIDGVMKPFECVGEIDELRSAYQTSQNNGYASLPFDVPESKYDVNELSAAQPWARQMIQ